MDGNCSKLDYKRVTYVRNDAFFPCDCGENIVLCNFSGNLYEGKCTKCNARWELRNNKFRIVQN